jgi:catechol 2,3-dioxygenase-like lactoylglutathione lyase family enzyme
VKPDYAKWMLDDPRMNFAISARGRTPGLDHLGIQVEDQTELQEVYGRLDQAGAPVLEQGETQCCYARSEKSWIDDPAGISWETFLTTGESTSYGDGTGERGVTGTPRGQGGHGLLRPKGGDQGSEQLLLDLNDTGPAVRRRYSAAAR